MERSLQFYKLLGLDFTPHRHGNGPEHYACELGKLVFEIYPCASKTQDTSATRIGFRVNSLDALVTNLQESGVTIISPPKDSPWGRRAVVDDPNGHRVELVEAKQGS
jgi:predicted enzyme related to lactoylglutathione lyase